MPPVLLVLNAGSSSLKFSLFRENDGGLAMFLRGQLEGFPQRPHFEAKNAAGEVIAEKRWAEATQLSYDEALARLLAWIAEQLRGEPLAAVGHRVVHGGPTYSAPTRIDAAVLSELERIIPLAPLHQPRSLAAIRYLALAQPQLPQVASFDTAFHRTQPYLARAIAIPRRFEAEGVERYGFHGLSFDYIASVLPKFDARAAAGRTIVAHLGNGSSLCALVGGKSIATTMGFSVLDGLVMGTRCGSLDPGVILYLMQQHGMNQGALENLLYRESGLLGVSGISSDVRTLLASGEKSAAEAIDLFVYRLSRELGSLAAALGGLDALVFTAGIGENSAEIRARVCQAASWLGVELDHEANQAGGPRLSTPGSRVSAWVIPTNEELVIARQTLAILR